MGTIYMSKKPSSWERTKKLHQYIVRSPFGWNLRCLKCHAGDKIRDETGHDTPFYQQGEQSMQSDQKNRVSNLEDEFQTVEPSCTVSRIAWDIYKNQ